MRILDWFRGRKRLVEEIWGLRATISGLKVDIEMAEAEADRVKSVVDKLGMRDWSSRPLETKTPAVDKKLEMLLQQQATPPWNKKEKLTRAQAARLMNIKESTLSSYASTGRGPKFYKNGKSVYYLLKEVEDYILKEVEDYMATHKKEKLTRAQAARLMNIKESTLSSYASTGRGPKLYKNANSVYYLLKEVEDYMATHKRRPYKKNYKVKKND